MFSIKQLVLVFLLLASVRGALPARQLIDPVLYNTILKYVYFTKASTQQPCSKPPFGAVTVKDFNIQPSDTQASLYRLDSNKELILAFPGSASTVDFVTDFTFVPLPYNTNRCSGCTVHTGFASAFVSIMSSLNTTIISTSQQYPDYNISVTGGSLGGALAKLAFDFLKDSSLGAKVTAGWSFGEPRVGNQAFADYSDTLSGASDSAVGIYHRVTHANDIVPQLPPTVLGYHHSRTEFWEQDGSSGVPSASNTYRCFGQEPLDCVNSQGGIGVQAHTTYAGYNATICS